VKCIGCHANDETLLGRQPTAFHSTIGHCASCHGEHRGTDALLTGMDHTKLAKIGLTLQERTAADHEQKQTLDQLLTWLRPHRPLASASSQQPVMALEQRLDCRGCHATRDRHVGLFGQECAACHGTATWKIAEFRHPSPRSLDCAQCHQAPPSHYMEHFNM